jgi:hypothetical protein
MVHDDFKRETYEDVSCPSGLLATITFRYFNGPEAHEINSVLDSPFPNQDAFLLTCLKACILYVHPLISILTRYFRSLRLPGIDNLYEFRLERRPAHQEPIHILLFVV